MEFVSDFVSEPDNAAIIKVVGIGGGGILAPIIAAALANSIGWNACFIVLALGAAAGMIISLILPRFKLK